MDRMASLEPLFIDVTWGSVGAKISRDLIWRRLSSEVGGCTLRTEIVTRCSVQGGSTAELTLQIATVAQKYLAQVTQ